MIDSEDNRLRVILAEFKLDHAEAINVVLVLNIVVFRIIVIETDGRPEEERHVIAEADPEAAVVFA